LFIENDLKDLSKIKNIECKLGRLLLPFAKVAFIIETANLNIEFISNDVE